MRAATEAPTARMADQQPGTTIWLPVARAMLPWLVLFVVGKPLLSLGSPSSESSSSFLRWIWFTADDAAFILPFLLFAAGLALARKLGHSRQVVRAVIVVGISVSAVSYALGAWLAPELDDRYLASLGPETADIRQFGPRTPAGILRKIRFVEANPPEEYNLRVSTPYRHPPNVLFWELHTPVAMAVFGLLNVFLGVLSSELTVDLTRGRRRNARLAIGVIGGIAFFACYVLASPIEPFLRDGTMRSGVAAAWIPLVLPVAEALLLAYLVRARRYG